MKSPLNSPIFQLQPHEIARGFSPLPPQSARTVEHDGRDFDFAFGRLDSGGYSASHSIWLRERGQENRGHWIVASSEPPFAPFDVQFRSVTELPNLQPTIASALDNRDGLTLARFVASPLENSAPYALLIPDGTGCWFAYGRTAAFDFAPNDSIAQSSQAAAAWLQSALRDDSSVKFANHWIACSAQDKIAALYGAPWLAQTRAAMRHVLRALSGWSEFNILEEWAIHASAPHSRGWSAPDEARARLLEDWGEWLARRFHARRLDNWPDYRCIGEAREDEITHVILWSASSSHQQMESLLWLRDWLRDAATPDECACLLSV